MANPLLFAVAEFTQTQRNDAGHSIDRFRATVRQHGQLRSPLLAKKVRTSYKRRASK
jgi:hypothetical protein